MPRRSSLSALYLSRLGAVLLVAAPPLLLDMLQCLPLLAAYLYRREINTAAFYALLAAFLAPRLALLSLGVLRRRYQQPHAQPS